MKWLTQTKPTTGKIICKFCGKVQPDMPELRTHVRGHHNAEWRIHEKQLKEFDEAHKDELGSSCSICAHRGTHSHAV